MRKERTTSETKPDALEKRILEPMSKFIPQPMTEPLTYTMLGLMTMLDTNIDPAYNDLKKQAWSLEAVEKRIEGCLTITIDKKSLIFITMLVNGNIGQMIMYSYYLQYWAKLNDVREITFEIFTSRIFAMGFLSEEFMQEMWDKQKVESGNLIDDGAAAVSIQFQDGKK